MATAAMTALRGLLRLVSAMLIVAIVIVSLDWAGHGPLEPPPLLHPEGLGLWLKARPPDAAVFSLVRLIALGLAWYVAVTTALSIAARLAGLRSLVRVSDLMSLRFTTRLVSGAIGLSLATSTLAMPSVAWAVSVTPDPGAPVMRWIPPTTAPPPVTPLSANSLAPPSPAPSSSAPLIAGPLIDESPPASQTWTVKPGENFWRIASKVLSTSWGRTPTPTETVAYWHTLIETNRDRLIDRSNPGLIYPTQVLILPAPPPRR